MLSGRESCEFVLGAASGKDPPGYPPHAFYGRSGGMECCIEAETWCSEMHRVKRGEYLLIARSNAVRYRK